MYNNIEKTKKHLIGKVIKSILINEENDLIVINTETTPVYLSFVGGCCSSCYVEHCNILVKDLEGAKVLDIIQSEWTEIVGENERGGVIDSMGAKVKTDRGYIGLETRLKSNGYYSGWIQIDVTPLDQYGGEIPLEDMKFRALTDF